MINEIANIIVLSYVLICIACSNARSPFLVIILILCILHSCCGCVSLGVFTAVAVRLIIK